MFNFSIAGDLPEWPRSLNQSFSEGLNSPVPENQKRCSIIVEEDDAPVESCHPFNNVRQWLSQSKTELCNNTSPTDGSPVQRSRKVGLCRQDAINISNDLVVPEIRQLSRSENDLTTLSSASSSEVDASVNKQRRRSGLEQYELSYEDMLRRSSQLWREIQLEQEQNGTVDAKKMAKFKMFL